VKDHFFIVAVVACLLVLVWMVFRGLYRFFRLGGTWGEGEPTMPIFIIKFSAYLTVCCLVLVRVLMVWEILHVNGLDSRVADWLTYLGNAGFFLLLYGWLEIWADYYEQDLTLRKIGVFVMFVFFVPVTTSLTYYQPLFASHPGIVTLQKATKLTANSVFLPPPAKKPLPPKAFTMSRANARIWDIPSKAKAPEKVSWSMVFPHIDRLDCLQIQFDARGYVDEKSPLYSQLKSRLQKLLTENKEEKFKKVWKALADSQLVFFDTDVQLFKMNGFYMQEKNLIAINYTLVCESSVKHNYDKKGVSESDNVSEETFELLFTAYHEVQHKLFAENPKYVREKYTACSWSWTTEFAAYFNTTKYEVKLGYWNQSLSPYINDAKEFGRHLFFYRINQNERQECWEEWAEIVGHPQPWAFRYEN